MFQLYDTTRRRICIASFLVLGLLPTALTAAWCMGRHLPGHLAAAQEELRRQLGIDVHIQSVQHPRPGVVVYEGVEIADPETNHGLVRCRRLEAKPAGSQAGHPRPTLALRVSQMEINAMELGRVQRLLHRVIEDSHRRLEYDLQLAAADVTLCANESQTFTHVSASLETWANRTQASARFQLAGGDPSEPIKLQIVRNREIQPPATGFDLDTGGDELPCNVLALGLSELKTLGPRCRFRGHLWANEMLEGWEGEISGQLAGVDLDQLVSEHLPHRLTGSADLTIQSAKFRHGRLEEAYVFFSAGPGFIDRSLIDSAVNHLGLTNAEELRNAKDRMPYEQLAFLLTLNGQGVKIEGCCSNKVGYGSIEPHTILANARGRILGEPQQQPRPIASLVRSLVPENTLQVPASLPTDWLLSRLPISQIIPATVAERQAAPHIQTRLVKPSAQ